MESQPIQTITTAMESTGIVSQPERPGSMDVTDLKKAHHSQNEKRRRKMHKAYMALLAKSNFPGIRPFSEASSSRTNKGEPAKSVHLERTLLERQAAIAALYTFEQKGYLSKGMVEEELQNQVSRLGPMYQQMMEELLNDDDDTKLQQLIIEGNEACQKDMSEGSKPVAKRSRGSRSTSRRGIKL
jgi:hypothetical protein